MDELLNLRSKLQENYSSLYDLILVRKKLVENIFDYKRDQASFLPDIEDELFKNNFFKKASLKEVLSLSLLVESHASSVSSYPLWSQRVHLKKYHFELFEQINPIMLLNFDKTLFKKLDFNASFDFLRNYL